MRLKVRRTDGRKQKMQSSTITVSTTLTHTDDGAIGKRWHDRYIENLMLWKHRQRVQEKSNKSALQMFQILLTLTSTNCHLSLTQHANPATKWDSSLSRLNHLRLAKLKTQNSIFRRGERKAQRQRKKTFTVGSIFNSEHSARAEIKISPVWCKLH